METKCMDDLTEWIRRPMEVEGVAQIPGRACVRACAHLVAMYMNKGSKIYTVEGGAVRAGKGVLGLAGVVLTDWDSHRAGHHWALGGVSGGFSPSRMLSSHRRSFWRAEMCASQLEKGKS